MKRQKKILIIEDEKDVAETIKAMLEAWGYAAEYSANPRKGLEKVNDFDLLLLDVMMPAMQGGEVLAEMKRRKIKVPVIVVSASGLPADIAGKLRTAYPKAGFVSKLLMHKELADEIRKRLGK